MTSHGAPPPDPGATAPAGQDLEALLPYLPELVDGLSAFAPLSDAVVELLASAGLEAGARVLDPASGRGAAAIGLAVRLGAAVEGVEEAAALVEAAAAEARTRGLPCAFRIGTAAEALAEAAGDPRDAVLWLGMGRTLGPPQETVGALRRAVRPGGLLLVEDGFLRDGAEAPPGLADYRPRVETLAALCAHGDLVIGEHVAPDEEVRLANQGDLATLQDRATALAGRLPALEGALAGWLGVQAAQVEELEGSLRSATWVLRRGAR